MMRLVYITAYSLVCEHVAIIFYCAERLHSIRS